MEEMINSNHRQLHSVAESLDGQTGPCKGFPLAVCKRLDSRPSPPSRPDAAVPSCALCIAVYGTGIQMRPNVCPHSGFCDKEKGTDRGGRALPQPQSHSLDSSYPRGITSN